MKTLERGVRKKGKKLYRFKQLLNVNAPPFFIWRTGIDIEERRILGIAGISVFSVPKEKWKLVLEK